MDDKDILIAIVKIQRNEALDALATAILEINKLRKQIEDSKLSVDETS